MESRAGNGKPPRGAISLGEARKQKIVADTALSRFELRKRKREYIPAAQVEEAWCMIAANFKARLLRRPVKLAPMLVAIGDANTIRTMLMDEAHEVLAELSSEANIGRIMTDLEKFPTVERGNGFDARGSWPRPS